MRCFGAVTTHYYAVRLCTKFGVLGTGAGDKVAFHWKRQSPFWRAEVN
jgi:hypothetical protein